jgi:hypothetical protein
MTTNVFLAFNIFASHPFNSSLFVLISEKVEADEENNIYPPLLKGRHSYDNDDSKLMCLHIIS